MLELTKRQQTLWQLICTATQVQPMLRLNREDDAIWVCDAPRKCSMAVCALAESQITQVGFLLRLDEQTRLWQIDLPLTDSLFAHTQAPLLPLPAQEERHAVYGLYRMLASHPAPVEEQPRDLLRRAIKLPAMPEKEMPLHARRLTELCAERLNRKQTLPAAAVFALEQYLCQEDQT